MNQYYEADPVFWVVGERKEGGFFLVFIPCTYSIEGLLRERKKVRQMKINWKEEGKRNYFSTVLPIVRQTLHICAYFPVIYSLNFVV